MSHNVYELIHCQAKRIHQELSSKSRPVIPGCVIQIPFESFSDRITSSRDINHMYGVVGHEVDYCTITTSRSYHVKFNLKYDKIPSKVLPLLQLPVHDSEIQIVRFLDQNASIDDPHLDFLFHKIEGEWKPRDQM